MPIKRLQGRRSGYAPIGKLRKGGPKRPGRNGGQIYGEELDHWRFTSETPGVAETFTKVYGEEPDTLDAYLPYNKLDDNWSCWQEEWAAGGLKHRCDGETCVLWLQPDGKYSQEPKPCPGGCKAVGRLLVILEPLCHEGHIGPIIVETHSIHDILSIEAALRATVEARGRDDLYGIGFTIRRVEREISSPDDKNPGKRIRRKHWLIELSPSVEYVLAQLARAQSDVLALPSGYDTVSGEVLDWRADLPPSDELRKAGLERMGPPGLPFGDPNEDPYARRYAEESAALPEIEGELVAEATAPELTPEERDAEGRLFDWLARQPNYRVSLDQLYAFVNVPNFREFAAKYGKPGVVQDLVRDWAKANAQG